MELLEIRRAKPDTLLQERLEKQAVNQPAVLIYTSGTTGNPKGVALSQDNVTWWAIIAFTQNDWIYEKEKMISYLPLCHIAAQIMDIFLVIHGRVGVCFADKMALQGTLLKTLEEARPILFFRVPRVYEKIQKLREIGKQNTTMKKAMATWAKGQAFKNHEHLMAGGKGGGLGYKIANKVVLSQVHNVPGAVLQRGPPPQTFQYFQSLDNAHPGAVRKQPADQERLPPGHQVWKRGQAVRLF